MQGNNTLTDSHAKTCSLRLVGWGLYSKKSLKDTINISLAHTESIIFDNDTNIVLNSMYRSSYVRAFAWVANGIVNEITEKTTE